MRKYIENFDLLKKSTVNEADYELRLAMVEDGSVERKFKIIEIETLTSIVNRSVMFKRSNYKGRVKQFVEDSLLNLDDKEVEEVMKTVQEKIVSKKVAYIKDLIAENKMEIYKDLCDFIREHKVEIITENKDNHIRIWEDALEGILKELSVNISLDEMIDFLRDNNLLVHDEGRKKVHINKSRSNPKAGWAYSFKDYKECRREETVA